MSNEAAFAIPQTSFSSAPAVEVRNLCDGQSVRQQKALAEIDELNKTVDEGFLWRLESRNEQVALITFEKRNAKGAVSIDEDIEPAWYWTSDVDLDGDRVVVGFRLGYVGFDLGYNDARARAVRVPRQ